MERRFLKNPWKTFYQEMPNDNCKIIAVYADGSGANVFLIKNGAVGELQEPLSENEKATFIFEWDKTYFEDAGYFIWTYLPEYFKIWGEDEVSK